MDFFTELKALINTHWPDANVEDMTAALDAAKTAVVNTHAADQGHSYDVFPDENDPNYGNPMGGPSDGGDAPPTDDTGGADPA